MEKRKSNVIRSSSRHDGVIEIDVENPDLIEDRKKYTWKRFSFLGVLIVMIILVIWQSGKPTGRHHLKHDYYLDATGQLVPAGTEPIVPVGFQAEQPVQQETAFMQVIIDKAKEDKCLELISQIRKLKQSGVVIESSDEAQGLIHQLQPLLREVLVQKYGPEPYYVEMMLEFPSSMPDYVTAGKDGRIVIEMAPIDLVPYCVYLFLNVVDNWKGGAFHRNAGHVLQAMVRENGPGLAFQEYHNDYPHKKWTLGYAGRPGGPAFYISTVDNTYNHGPGSQGSKTEADGVFGRVLPNSPGEAVVLRMQKQPGAGKGSGFIADSSNFIRIISLKLIKDNGHLYD